MTIIKLFIKTNDEKEPLKISVDEEITLKMLISEITYLRRGWKTSPVPDDLRQYATNKRSLLPADLDTSLERLGIYDGDTLYATIDPSAEPDYDLSPDDVAVEKPIAFNYLGKTSKDARLLIGDYIENPQELKMVYEDTNIAFERYYANRIRQNKAALDKVVLPEKKEWKNLSKEEKDAFFKKNLPNESVLQTIAHDLFGTELGKFNFLMSIIFSSYDPDWAKELEARGFTDLGLYLQLALHCKADVDFSPGYDVEAYTPLTLASKKYNTEVVKQLLSVRGIQVDRLDGSKQTPLERACKENVDRYKLSPEAARKDQADTIELLVSHGASVRETWWYRNDPSLLLCCSGNTRALALLLAYGFKINQFAFTESFRRSPLRNQASKEIGLQLETAKKQYPETVSLFYYHQKKQAEEAKEIKKISAPWPRLFPAHKSTQKSSLPSDHLPTQTLRELHRMIFTSSYEEWVEADNTPKFTLYLTNSSVNKNATLRSLLMKRLGQHPESFSGNDIELQELGGDGSSSSIDEDPVNKNAVKIFVDYRGLHISGITREALKELISERLCESVYPPDFKKSAQSSVTNDRDTSLADDPEPNLKSDCIIC